VSAPRQKRDKDNAAKANKRSDLKERAATSIAKAETRKAAREQEASASLKASAQPEPEITDAELLEMVGGDPELFKELKAYGIDEGIKIKEAPKPRKLGLPKGIFLVPSEDEDEDEDPSANPLLKQADEPAPVIQLRAKKTIPKTTTAPSPAPPPTISSTSSTSAPAVALTLAAASTKATALTSAPAAAPVVCPMKLTVAVEDDAPLDDSFERYASSADMDSFTKQFLKRNDLGDLAAAFEKKLHVETMADYERVCLAEGAEGKLKDTLGINSDRARKAVRVAKMRVELEEEEWSARKAREAREAEVAAAQDAARADIEALALGFSSSEEAAEAQAAQNRFESRKPRVFFQEDAAGESPARAKHYTERRFDGTDGPFTLAEFIHEYGEEKGCARFAIGAPERIAEKTELSSIPRIRTGALGWELVDAARESPGGCTEAKVEMAIPNKKGRMGRELVEPRYIVFVEATMIMHVFMARGGRRETSFRIEKGTADFLGKAGPLGRKFKVQVYARESTAFGIVEDHDNYQLCLTLVVMSRDEAKKLEVSLNVGDQTAEARQAEEAAITAQVMAKREADKARKLELAAFRKAARAEASEKRAVKRAANEEARKAKQEARKAKEEEDLANGIPPKKGWFQRSPTKGEAASTSKKAAAALGGAGLGAAKLGLGAAKLGLGAAKSLGGAVVGVEANSLLSGIAEKTSLPKKDEPGPYVQKDGPASATALPSPRGTAMLTFKKGDRVYGEDDGSWYAAIVTGAKFLKSGKEVYDIDYEGFEGDKDYADFDKPLTELAPAHEFEGPKAFRIPSRWDEDEEDDEEAEEAEEVEDAEEEKIEEEEEEEKEAVSAPATPASKKSTLAKGVEERRFDGGEGPYTKAEFFELYGGYAEWDESAALEPEPSANHKSSSSSRKKEERRYDGGEGPYTKAEFFAEYGGYDEWDAAATDDDDDV